MKLIVGLGNPGPRYETTRHNVGFLAIDHLVDHLGLKHSNRTVTGPDKKYHAELYTLQFTAQGQTEKLLLMKPQTFMNVSGKSVGPAFQFLKLRPADLIVLHDDLDLDPLTIRFKAGGGTGGHNGLKSIDAHIGAENNGYIRARIGIGHPARSPEPTSHMDVADYVLQSFSQPECDELPALFERLTQAVELIIKDPTQGLSKAMNLFHYKNG